MTAPVTAEQTRVDVVDALERTQEFVDFVLTDKSNGSELLRRSRKAITELLAADREYDEAQSAAIIWSGETEYARYSVAQKRRAAALAVFDVSGEKP